MHSLQMQCKAGPMSLAEVWCFVISSNRKLGNLDANKKFTHDGKYLTILTVISL